MEIYIDAIETISPQDTFGTDEFLITYQPPEKEYHTCKLPDYKQIIDTKLLRRMSKIVKMGVACSLKVLQKAEIEQPDAIIVGTGLACVDDTIKFLDQIIENKESLLNPTAFIQSTHNTVSGQIALLLGCKNYNFTFTQQKISFETAFLDAMMMLNEPVERNILLGGIDEITPKSFELLKKAGCVKSNTEDIYNSDTHGYIPGEGATFFVLSNKKSGKNLVRVKAISIFNELQNGADIQANLSQIIEEKGITLKNIDVLISGINGDIAEKTEYKIIQQMFDESIHVGYKHLCGEYDTAQSFAMWLGTEIIQRQSIPGIIKLNKVQKDKIDTVLIHTYSKKYNHAFILIGTC